MKLSEFSVLRPITVTMATVCGLVFGALSLQRLPLTMLPEFAAPSLRVSVDYPSSSPEEVEHHITRPLEEVLSTVSYLESLNSTSSGSGASLRMEFKQGTDMDFISLEVRDRVDQVRGRLPDDIDRIFIRRWQSTDSPVFRLAVGWRGEREDLHGFTEEVLRPGLERIDGVANVDVRGVQPKQILVELDQDQVQAYGLDIFELTQTLRGNNLNVSGGYIKDGGRKYSLRTVGELQSVEELRRLPLAGGHLVLADVARIRYDFPERSTFSRLNGQEALTVVVYKASTANVVNVCHAVRQELRALENDPRFSGNLSIQVFSDQSAEIMASLNGLGRAGIYGGLLAMGVLFLFLLNLRTTLIISLAIPVSIVVTCAMVYLLRVFGGATTTLNVVSLMGLMVAVGMVVDNSVVVLENIFRYRQEKGLSSWEAAVAGSREVGMAVVASTSTTVVVFVSFIFAPNSMAGRFLRDFGIMVSVALMASLLVALTLIPMLSSRMLAGAQNPPHAAIRALTEWYGKLMGWLLRWRVVALVVMGLLGYGSYTLFIGIDREFMPRVAERELRIDVLMERSFSPEDMEEIFARSEKNLLAQKEELEIVAVSSSYGQGTSRGGLYRGRLDIFLKESGEMTPTQVLSGRIRETLPEIPGVEFRTGRMRHRGRGSEMGVEVDLKGPDPAVLARYGERVKGVLSGLPGVKDAQTSLETGDDEIHVVVNRKKAEKLGVSSTMVARNIASALSSRAVSYFRAQDGEVGILLQLDEESELSLQKLQNLQLANRQGEMVPLHSLVDYSYETGPRALQREDRRPELEVTANTEQGSGMRMSRMVDQAMEEVPLPPGYSWSQGRQWARFQRSEQDTFFSIMLAVVFMYIIMAALFESFVHPFTILLTVPFSLIGVEVVFNLTGTSLNQMAYLGILVLFGIVVNNGIILVNHINILRLQGMSRDQAILQGGKDRLRPILMTAATSVFGLLPLSLPFILPQWFPSSQGGGRMWAPVSLAVFGGLTTSTCLTLIVLPSVYSWMDDLSRGCCRLAEYVWRAITAHTPSGA